MNAINLEILINEYNQLSGSVVDYTKYSYYAATHHSTSIEGSTLTESQVINLLEFGKTAVNKPFEHHQMVADHYAAMLFVAEKAKEKINFTPSFIQQIAQKVMSNTGSTVNTIAGTYNISEGNFRLGGVMAGTRIFPDYKKVPSLIAELCKRTNEKLLTANTLEEKCDLAFSLHFDFVSIHPFGDGYGRCARLLMNFVQAYFGLPMSIVFKNDRLRYIAALESARKQEDIKPFLQFSYNQYAKFLKKEIADLKKQIG